jgi:hypothetical protein
MLKNNLSFYKILMGRPLNVKYRILRERNSPLLPLGGRGVPSLWLFTLLALPIKIFNLRTPVLKLKI